jgi:hypothetical protein
MFMVTGGTPGLTQPFPKCSDETCTYFRSAIGDSSGFKPTKKDLSSNDKLFPDNPARRISTTGHKPTGVTKGVKKANESDVSDLNVESVLGVLVLMTDRRE